MTLVLVLVLAALAFERPARAAAWDKPGWTLTFQDEFDGAAVDATNGSSATSGARRRSTASCKRTSTTRSSCKTASSRSPATSGRQLRGPDVPVRVRRSLLRARTEVRLLRSAPQGPGRPGHVARVLAAGPGRRARRERDRHPRDPRPPAEHGLHDRPLGHRLRRRPQERRQQLGRPRFLGRLPRLRPGVDARRDHLDDRRRRAQAPHRRGRAAGSDVRDPEPGDRGHVARRAGRDDAISRPVPDRLRAGVRAGCERRRGRHRGRDGRQRWEHVDGRRRRRAAGGTGGTTTASDDGCGCRLDTGGSGHGRRSASRSWWHSRCLFPASAVSATDPSPRRSQRRVGRRCARRQPLHLTHHRGGVDAPAKRHHRQPRWKVRRRATQLLVDAQDER